MKIRSEEKFRSRFLLEEVPKSIGISYAPQNIKKYFDIKTKNELWRIRKKK